MKGKKTLWKLISLPAHCILDVEQNRIWSGIRQVLKTPTYTILLVDSKVSTECEEEHSSEHARKGL